MPPAPRRPPSRTGTAPSTRRYYSDARQGVIEAPQITRTIANRPRLPVGLGSQNMEDPIAFWQRTLQEQGGIQHYGGGGGGGGGSRGRGYGGGGRGGGGGGGGGGGAGGPDWAAMLAAINAPYDLAMRQGQDRAEGGRRRVATENGVLSKAIAGQNTASTQAIAQRAAILKQILAEAQQRQQGFNQIAQTDLAGQGISSGGYNQVAQIEAQRLQGQGAAQQRLGGDLDALIREQMAARSAYAAQSQRDALSAISDAESKLMQQIALQRAQEEAKIRAEAAAAGKKI